ncbi:endonuclease III domain-containing protein [Desmospora activa]|uniref:DNA-3-methyladenine glycosylase III n=1 Tax=Desmospora activa DSM 45169 TaxID=1121389 RepID=A0A2T4ZBL1_9BACL|nr:endonuclease [Desmospora activa]PTM59279.1 DNA-3-methyladenine glycosylase III [Desmospora activa DSM 45169]
MIAKKLTPTAVRQGWEILRQWRPALTTAEWWGVEDSFERAIGAVLVQRTTWRQAFQALTALRKAGWTQPATLAALDEAVLRQQIRPAGFYHAKAATLIRLAQWWTEAGGKEFFHTMSTLHLRQELLSIRGIGAETADLILSDALARSTFVVDAYSRRIWSRWLGITELEDDFVRRTVITTLEQRSNLSRLHALLVELGKDHCRKGKPRCVGCPLQQSCVYYRGRPQEG